MTKVVHLIDASTPQDMLEQIRLLAGQPDEIVSIGPPPAWPLGRPAKAVHCPMGSPALAAKRLPPAVAAAEVVHAWSAPAASAAVSAQLRRRPVFSLSCLPEGPLRGRLIDWARAGEVFVTVPTEASRRELIGAGVPQWGVKVLPPAAGPIADAAAGRSKVRAELGVGDGHVLLVAPGEMTRGSGHKYAPWVHAVLRQVRPDLRLVVPGTGPDEEHVRYYAGTTGLDSEVFLTEGRYWPRETLAAADLAVFFHERDCGAGALAAAMAAGLPIVASRTPDVVECTGDGEAAVLVDPGSPREGSAGVLRVLDDADLSRRIGQAASRRAAECFSVELCRNRLAEVYASLCASSPATASQ
jgi:glycosyltransferase involved in cell wall biosynthesis